MYRVVAGLLLMCLFPAVTWSQGEVEKLPGGINTDLYDETTPVLSPSGDRLFFTRTAAPDFNRTLPGMEMAMADSAMFAGHLSTIFSQLAGTPVEDPVSSRFNQDIWYVHLDGDSIGMIVHPGYPLNSALPNSLVSTGMYPGQYILLNQFYDDGSMRAGFSGITLHDDGTMSFPEPIHIYDFAQKGSDVHMTMSADGNFIVMSIDAPGGLGQHDLYVSFYLRPNVWSSPIHLGAGINTPYRESTPYLTRDRRYLYFSSDRPGGTGGSDIYRSERLDYTWLNWSTPELVSGDANSRFDDSHPYFNPENTWMYFTSRREGSSDIYRMRLTPLPRLSKPIVVRGMLKSTATGGPIRGEVFWGQQSSSDFLEYFSTYNGAFEVVLSEYEPYKFMPRKPNHHGVLATIDPRVIDRQGRDTVDLILYLQPWSLSDEPPTSEAKSAEENESNDPERPESAAELTSGKKLSFYDINFVKGKAIMLPSSQGALDYLARIMKQHSQLVILITGHTDNVGNETDLIELSQMRAEAIREELVRRGIDKSRMKVAGLGAAQPIAPNDTENSRERNRRVEIQILKS